MRSLYQTPPYMNLLSVGADKTSILECVDYSSNFLILDDGPLIDALTVKRRKVVEFDVTRHHLNPLHGMNYRPAREFVSVLDAVFPEGESTLTKENARFEILSALLDDAGELRGTAPGPHTAR